MHLKAHREHKKIEPDARLIIHMDTAGSIIHTDPELLYCPYAAESSCDDPVKPISEQPHAQKIQVGDLIYDHVPVEKRDQLKLNLESLSPYKPVFHFRFPLIIQAGHIHYAEWIFQGIFLKDRTLEAIHISGEIFADDSLQYENSQIYQTVAEVQDYLGVGTWEWAFLTDEFRYSDKTEILFALSGEGESFQSFLDRIHPDDIQTVKAKLQLTMEELSEFDIECRISLPDDYIHFIRLYGGFLTDELHLPYRIVGSVEDITDRKLMENSLKMYQSLVHQSPMSVLIVDPHNFTFLDVNHTACEMLGYDCSELNHFKLDQILDPGNDSDNIEIIIEGLKMVQSVYLETELLKKNGDSFIAELTAGYFYLGAEPYLVLFANNITDRKKAERKLHQAREEAEQANVTKDRFVSLVAHDLKNPISANLGFLELVLNDEDLDLPETYRQHFAQLLEDNQLMLNMIKEVLNINRLKTGRIQLEKSFFEPGEVAQSVTRSLKDMIEKKQATVDVQIPENQLFFGDQRLFREVVYNLVSNAIKFIFPGGKVEVFSPNQDSSTLVVRDNGTGIPEKIIPRLFLHEEKTSTVGTSGERGTGFGLPLVRDILEAHGGSIEVDSKEGEGSSFQLEIPQVKPQILIIEDDDRVRPVLSRQLQHYRFDVREASNGREGLSIVSEEKIHLVLLDPGLPDISGYDILQHMSERDQLSQTAVIVITGDTGMESREHSLRLGAVDFVPKPTRMHDLIPRIRHALRSLKIIQ